MNTHRLFIAINLPERIKNRFESYENSWTDLPAKWTKPYNLHITVLFLGNVAEENIPAVLEIAKGLAEKYPPMQIKLNKISYGPPKKVPPRMVWITVEKNELLAQLKNDLEKVLTEQNVHFQIEDRGFNPHITFARLNNFELRQMNPEEVPQIDEDINFDFEAKKIDVMESELKKSGSRYEVLGSFDLKGEE
ncbi:MAG: RNA 2',3'-cyclic phosphodiesterase [Candidatus Paceibacterota bacterium]|jgi:2'-5' RNA ligase